MKYLILFAIFYISVQNLNAQNSYLYLYPNCQNACPNNDKKSNNEILNQILEQNQVTEYKQTFPGAQTPNLANTYHIYAKGNIDSLKSALFSTGLFDSIIKVEYFTASCTSPHPSINDAQITSGAFSNYALEKIEANCAWSFTKGDSRVIMAIADTDIDTFHEDMRNKFVKIWKADITSDYCLHGTKVSGVALANTHNSLGIASIGYNIKGAGYRVGDIHRPPTDSSGCGGDPWPAIWQAYIDGQRIINVSWHGAGFDATVPLIEEITKHGTVLVFAAGNDNAAKYHSIYANIPGVIVVSSTDQNDNHGIGSSHAHNEFVDLCAPGHFVTTTNAFNRYWSSLSTSITAPQVSGTIALMLSINPCLSPKEIEFILKQTCDPIANASSYPGQLGAGRLNAYKAVRMAQVMSCMNIKGIEINTICRPGKVSGLSNPQFTVKMEGGLPPYKYKWEPIVSTTGGISNTTVLDHDDIANPTIISSTAPHIAYYRLIVTDQFLPEKMAIKIIKVQLSDNMTPIVAMRDSYMDMLNEANDQRTTNVYDIDTWTSQDVWNRQINDGGTNHENPEYFATPPHHNFIYTRVHNYGCVASTEGQKLKLYWSKASTGEKWEDNWKTTNVKDKFGALTMPGGREITPSSGISIPALAPATTTILNYPWSVPKPQDYEGSPNSFDACVLARIEKAETYPFGMTIPEIFGVGVGQNVRNNNTIVTRNFVLNNLNPLNKKISTREAIVGNGDNVAQVFNLRFEADRVVYPAMGGDFSTLGSVTLHLGSLYDRWIQAGGEGEFTSRNANAKTVTMQGNSLLELKNISFSPSERFTINVEFALDSNVSITDSSFQRMHLRQYLSTKPDSLYGAVGYEIKINPATQNNQRKTLETAVTSSEYFKVSPNPTSGIIMISYNGDNESTYDIVVTDMVGKKVMSDKATFSQGSSKEINLSRLASGIYLINLNNTQGKTEVFKIVKE